MFISSDPKQVLHHVAHLHNLNTCTAAYPAEVRDKAILEYSSKWLRIPNPLAAANEVRSIMGCGPVHDQVKSFLQGAGYDKLYIIPHIQNCLKCDQPLGPPKRQARSKAWAYSYMEQGAIAQALERQCSHCNATYRVGHHMPDGPAEKKPRLLYPPEHRHPLYEQTSRDTFVAKDIVKAFSFLHHGHAESAQAMAELCNYMAAVRNTGKATNKYGIHLTSYWILLSH